MDNKIIDVLIQPRITCTKCKYEGKMNALKVPANYNYARFQTGGDSSQIPPCPRCGGTGIYKIEFHDFIHGANVAVRTLENLSGTWDVLFHKCIQDSQLLGAENEHLSARVFFRIWESNSRVKYIYSLKEYVCTIRQPHGESFSYEDSPLEVDTPEELMGKLNFEDFSDAVEDYYRHLIGKEGKAIKISPEARHTTMIDNSMNEFYGFAIVKSSSYSGAW